MTSVSQKNRVGGTPLTRPDQSGREARGRSANSGEGPGCLGAPTAAVDRSPWRGIARIGAPAATMCEPTTPSRWHRGRAGRVLDFAHGGIHIVARRDQGAGGLGSSAAEFGSALLGQPPSRVGQILIVEGD